jgi:hypothetical protein
MWRVLFLEDQARLVTVVHAVLGGALVAATTHLVVWMRGYRRGRFERHRGVRRLALAAALLYLASFAFGNLLYPTYKIKVRGEYLDSGTGVVSDYRERRRATQTFRTRYYPTQTPASDSGIADRLPSRAAKLARWFDVKEHCVALAMFLAVALASILWVWDPRRHSSTICPIVMTMAVVTSSAAWFAAVVGLITTSYRSVGGFG